MLEPAKTSRSRTPCSNCDGVLDNQFIFILGASRSGTTWLQSILSECPDVCTHTELKVFAHYLKPWFNAWKWDEQDTAPHGLPAIWSHDEFHDFMKEFLTRIYGKVIDPEIKNPIIVDKIPHSDDIERIETLLSKPKYIHIIRDGRDVATSLISASKGWGKAWAPSTIATAAQWWCFGVNGARMAQRYQEEGRYLEIRYEDMLAEPLDTVTKIRDFLAFDSKIFDVAAIVEHNHIENMKKRTKFLNSSLPSGFIRKGQSGDWRKEWTAQNRYDFHRTAGTLLLEYGYADEFWWAEKAYQRSLIPVQKKMNPRRVVKRILQKTGILR